MVVIDIFTGRRSEDVIRQGQTIQVPELRKKEYLLVSIDDDRYVTLMDEESCDVRSDLTLKNNPHWTRELQDVYRGGNDQIRVTVLQALGEEQMMKFEIIKY